MMRSDEIMANGPNSNEALAGEIRLAYDRAELTILDKIARGIERGKTLDDADWKVRKLKDIRVKQKQIDQILTDLDGKAEQMTYRALTQAYVDGMYGVDTQLNQYGERPKFKPLNSVDKGIEIMHSEHATEAFGATNVHALHALAAQTSQTLIKQHFQILRSSLDAYRYAAEEAVNLAVAGTMSRTEASQYMLNNLANKGIRTFRDKAGRNWNMGSYAEMTVRQGIATAQVEGAINRMAQQGKDLVYVSDHPEECKLCRPWEGKVLSISGTHGQFTSVDTARGAGLWHVGCGHKLYAYLRGFTELPKNTKDASGNAERQQQRQIERNIRKWKMRNQVAITPQNKMIAKNKIKLWNKKMSGFTATTGRKRLRHREVPRAGKIGGRGSVFQTTSPTTDPWKIGEPNQPKKPVVPKQIPKPPATRMPTVVTPAIIKRAKKPTPKKAIQYTHLNNTATIDNFYIGEPVDRKSLSKFHGVVVHNRTTKTSSLGKGYVKEKPRYAKGDIKSTEDLTKYMHDWNKSIIGTMMKPKFFFYTNKQSWRNAGGGDRILAFNRGGFEIAFGPEETKKFNKFFKTKKTNNQLLTRIDNENMFNSFSSAVHEMIHSWQASSSEHLKRKIHATDEYKAAYHTKEEGLTEWLAKQYTMDFLDNAGITGTLNTTDVGGGQTALQRWGGGLVTSNEGTTGSYAEQVYIYDEIAGAFARKGYSPEYTRASFTNFKLNTYKDDDDYVKWLNEELEINKETLKNTLTLSFWKDVDVSKIKNMFRGAIIW